jgi:hypothetical protein
MGNVSIRDITAYVWNTSLNNYSPVATSDFEVHKDPIRTQHSDGNQYRLKINAISSTIDEVNPVFNMFGIINTTDTNNEHFWLKKCFKVEVNISSQIKVIYLLPMSYNVNLEKSVTYICMEMSERLLELGNFKYFTELGLSDFTTFFKNRITEANNYLNELAKLACKLDKSFEGFKIIPRAPVSTMDRASNQINNNNIMQLADQLFELGWFKCPAYASYDSFDLQAMSANPKDKCIITYKILDLGDIRKITNAVNVTTMALYSGLQDQTVKPFFDTAFFDNFINKKATFEFSKYGSWVNCLMDGGLEQGDSTNRIELEALFGSKENMEAKLCCLKQLVAINPQVYSYVLPNMLLGADFGVYNLGSGGITAYDFIVAINYSATNLDGRTDGSNLTFTTKLKTLKFNYPIIQTDFYNNLNINGTPCLNG